MIRAALIFLATVSPAFARAFPQSMPADAAFAVATWTEAGPQISVSGRANPEGGAVTEDDNWHIGSLTKAMTATLAARTVAAGLLDWESQVGSVLTADPVWQDVTLAELLTHRSGMAANLPRWRTMLQPDRAGYVDHMLGSSPAGSRGDFFYSNAGYVVAGAMIEAVQGASWEALMHREVFEPLGMEGAGFGAPDTIWGHRGSRAIRPGPGADNIPAMGPAGTVHVSPRAMLRFLAAHATRDPAYLPQAIWARLHEPVGDYAMGWGVEEGELRHAGSNTMWFAQVRVGQGRAAFAAINHGSERARDATAEALSGVWQDAPRATPEAPRPSE